MEYHHRQTSRQSLAPHQIAALRDAVNHYQATPNSQSNELIFLAKLLNSNAPERLAVVISEVDEGVAVVNEDTKLWVRRARKTTSEQE